MTAVIVAAGIANHLRGKREFSRMPDIVRAHKMGLDHLLTHFMPKGKQFGHVWLDELNSDHRHLIFQAGYNLLNAEREISDSISLQVDVMPTFGGWIDIEITGPLPAGSLDRARVRDSFHLALCTPVEWSGTLFTYKTLA